MKKAVLEKITSIKYVSEVISELKKVTWPSRKDTVEMTILVVSVSTVVALYLGGLDYLFTQGMRIIIN